jgi:plastocyanin
VPPDAPDRRRSVLFLETAPQGAFEDADLPRPVLDQRNQTFVPWVLAIPVGTTVDFPNSDPTFHNVFSLSKPRRFDLGRYPKGAVRSVRFDRPGVVRVFCEIHAHMNAYILVFAHRYFATTDDAGRYRIPGVPPGRYRLVLWHDGREREVREVEVPAGGTAEADFAVR